MAVIGHSIALARFFRVASFLAYAVSIAILVPSASASATTITVNTTSDAVADDGLCTFREAIVAANTNTASGLSAGECVSGAPGLDTIVFAIPGAGVKTITPSVTLQAITEPVFIDGYTQPGASANTNPRNAGINTVLLIELNGSSSGGLRVNAAGTVIRGLCIHGGGDAITINAANVTIAGNFLGTNPAGTAGDLVPSNGIAMITGNNNLIGGPAAADRNLISGYRDGSIALDTDDGTVIQGNYIGTNAAGTPGLQDLSATPYGIETAPRTTNTVIVDNLISGNANGVIAQGGGVIQGNLIGTQKDGISPLGNLTRGVLIDGTGFVVGGTAPGQGNTIAFNGFGVQVLPSGVAGRITGNSISSSTHLGIGLSPFSFNPLANDPCDVDTQAANLGQNYPVIASAVIGSGDVTIVGSLNSAAGTTFRVEFFSNASCNPSGNGEGKTYLGFSDVTTDGTCDASFGPLVFAIPSGQPVISATATDPAGNTSEFSACLTAGAGSFNAVVPCRILDTRNPAGTYGGPALADAGTRTFVLAGQCAVPAGASALSVNLTVTQPTNGPGFLTIFPSGTTRPVVSSINYKPGQTRANNAIVPLGAAGGVDVYCGQGGGTVHFILDVNGYFQ